MKNKRSKKRWCWKDKHLFKHYSLYNLELAIELSAIGESMAWEWKKRRWYENAPKKFRKALAAEFKAKCTAATRKKFLDYDHEDDYLCPVFKKNAAWWYW